METLRNIHLVFAFSIFLSIQIGCGGDTTPDAKTTGNTSQDMFQDCGSIAHGEAESRTKYESQTVLPGSTCQSQVQIRTCNDGMLGAFTPIDYIFDDCSVEAAECGDIAEGETDSRTMFQAETVPSDSTCESQTQTRICANGLLTAFSPNEYTFATCTVEPSNPAGYPDATTTGYKPGTDLKTDCVQKSDGYYYINGAATLENCQFDGTVMVTTTEPVIIRNSLVNGIIRSDVSPDALTNVLIEDVEVDAQNLTNFPAVGMHGGFACKRCKVYNANVCFKGSKMTIEDSYCFDLYGSEGSHNEPILAYGSGNVIRGNNLIANWNAASSGGGMSAVIAIYNGHNGVFGPLGDVLVEGNRIENKSGAFYCMYTGQRDADATGNMGPTGVVVKNNLFIAADSYADIGCTGNSVAYPDWVGGGINKWESNLNEDGNTVPEPPSN